jgi:hypothetical protein
MHKKTIYTVLATSTIALTLTGTTVLAGHRYFNDRPAQNAAAQFFPASAMAVMIADIKPNSAEQVLTFKRLSDALKATELRPKVNEMREGMTAEMPLMSGIWPHLNRSVAAMTWSETRKVSKKVTQKVPIKSKVTAKGKKTKQPKMQTIMRTVIENVTDYHYLTVLSVDDAKSVRKTLDTNAKKSVDASGLHLVYLKDIEMVATTVGDYLLVADTATSLYKAVAVQSGRLPAMTKTPGFIDAQSHLPAEANIFCYIAPQGLEAAQKAAGTITNLVVGTATTASLGMSNNIPATGIAWAMTIREEGVAVDARIPWKDTNTKRMQALSRLQPISADAYSKMPPGAMGVFAIAQPGGYWDIYDAGITDAKARKEMQISLRDMGKDLGMNIPQDIVAGLKGNLLVGVYPSASKPKEVDVLVVADNDHGATPDALVAKVQAMIDKQNEDKPVFTQEKHGSDQFWRMVIDEKGQGKSEEKTGIDAWESQMRYTTATGAFQVATSPALLEQSLQARRGNTSLLLSSPEYATMRSRMVPGAQTGLLVSPSAILALFQEDIIQSMGESKLDKDDILNVLGEPGKGGMVVSAGYNNGVFSSQFVLPINYERAMRLMQAGIKEIDKGEKEAKPRIDTTP